MRPVTAAFLRTVKSSHPAVFRATVCEFFQTTTTPTGTRIPILAGDVKVDGTADVRGTLDLTVDGSGMWPRRAADLLAPYGNEIYVQRGVAYNDVSIEWVGLGYYRIDTPEQDQPSNGPIRISGSDRMAGIVEAKLLSPVQFQVGEQIGIIVEQLVADIYPNAVIGWDDTTYLNVLQRDVITTEDRFAFLDEVITSQGKIWYWDYTGALVIKSVPDPAAPVFDVMTGRGGVLLGSNRKVTRAGVFNAVVATGQGADTAAPARGVAIDNNPASPTRYGGRFGKVPTFYNSALIATDSQAAAAAVAQLRLNLGLPYSVDLSLSPNPALEPYDAVNVRQAVDEGVEIHVIDTLTVPLTSGAAMSATTRQQTLVLPGPA